MAGIAIVMDLLRKNPSFSSPQFSATSAVVAASAAAAVSTPFASKLLVGSPKLPIAYCDDAGLVFPNDYIANRQRVAGNCFEQDKVKQTTKAYYFEPKPLFSAFEWRQLAMTSVRSFLMFYLPLLEPSMNIEEDDEDFLQANQEDGRVDLVVPFKKSVKQIARETTVVTTRRVLERLSIHYVSQRMAWKLLKDVPKSAVRKAERGLPTTVYILRVSRTTFRGHSLGVAASWIVQVGIEIYRFFSRLAKSEEETTKANKSEQVKVLGKKFTGVTIRCGSSLVFASVGAGIGAALIRPSLGQWIGCAAGDLAGPIIVTLCLEKFLHVEL